MREPKRMLVNRKEDISNLIEGDLVKVAFGKSVSARYRVFGGLNLVTDKYRFISIPEIGKYMVPVYLIWESHIKDFNFPGDHSIMLSHDKSEVKAVDTMSGEYATINRIMQNAAKLNPNE